MTRGRNGMGAKHGWRAALPAALVAALLAVALCACASTAERKPEENIVPTDYKPDLLRQLRLLVIDPAGIRDAYIAEPALRPYGSASRYVVCIRYNAKDNDGRYEGNKEKAAFYYAGRMTQIVDATREMCGSAAYQPFPELEKLCRELVCKS
jgi:hypothetical protein